MHARAGPRYGRDHRLFPGSGGNRKPDPPEGDRALATLRERYARGEIDGEEYERRRHDLTR